MTYIMLAAGKGTRLYPLTLNYPKSLYKLDRDTTVLRRMVELIKKYDKDAEIVVVTGFKSETIQRGIDGVIYINNPFYEVTNSIASLWFARKYLESDNVTIINSDIVMEEKLVQLVICKKIQFPKVCIDSSIKNNGDYNVEVKDDRVLVMSKDLEQYFGEYAGVTKLDAQSSRKLKKSIEQMVDSGMYDQWYENALVQMIFNEDFKLFYIDIKEYRWTEVDCVNDLLLAKQIHEKDCSDDTINR